VQIGGLVRADRRHCSGLVLKARPLSGVRARVLLVRVRSPEKKPERVPCHPGAAGKGKAGWANASEPLMTSRHCEPWIGDGSAGGQDPCRREAAGGPPRSTQCGRSRVPKAAMCQTSRDLTQASSISLQKGAVR
jgi:hypothetical protein